MKATLKKDGDVVISNLQTTYSRSFDGTFNSITGSFVTKGVHIESGEGYQLHLESGKWGDIFIHPVVETSGEAGNAILVKYRVVGGEWQERKAPE